MMWTSEIPAFFWRPKVRGAEQDKAEGVGLFQSGQYFKSYQVRGPRRAPERFSEIGELSNRELEHETWQLLVKRGNFGKGSTFLMGTSPTHGGFNWHVTSPEGKQFFLAFSKSGFKPKSSKPPQDLDGENDPFIDDLPIETSIYEGFSMAMLNNQRVNRFTALGDCFLSNTSRPQKWVLVQR